MGSRPPRSTSTGSIVLVLVAMLSLAAVAACGEDDGTGSDQPTSADPVHGELLVFAASSLTDTFTAVGDAFHAAHPGVTVTFNFQSSSALATQIDEGAPADVFASANDAQMRVVTDAGNANDPVIFATNSPVIVVPAGDDKVRSLEDLAKDGLRLVLAEQDVPVGKYARAVLTNASTAGGLGTDFSDRVLANLRSNEPNVRAVLTKVQLGEADAGIVYATDAAIAGHDVDVVDIPDAYNVVASYPMAVAKDAGNPEAANAWVAFVLSSEGQAILRSFGFGAVP